MRVSRIAALAAVLAATTVLGPIASAQPSEDVLDQARAAVQIGQEKARGMSHDAPGQENRAQGLERAAEAIAAAADRAAERGAISNPGQGNALGRGRSAMVHAALLAGGSPSDLPSHGASVSAIAHAFAQMKAADRPGRGLGRGNAGSGDDN